jgi:hypothetical protein
MGKKKTKKPHYAGATFQNAPEASSLPIPVFQAQHKPVNKEIENKDTHTQSLNLLKILKQEESQDLDSMSSALKNVLGIK